MKICNFGVLCITYARYIYISFAYVRRASFSLFLAFVVCSVPRSPCAISRCLSVCTRHFRSVSTAFAFTHTSSQEASTSFASLPFFLSLSLSVFHCPIWQCRETCLYFAAARNRIRKAAAQSFARSISIDSTEENEMSVQATGPLALRRHHASSGRSQ